MKNHILSSVFSFSVAVALVLLFSKCSKEEIIVCGMENICGEDEDLTWLKDEVENQGEMYNKYFYVSKAHYQGQVVFVFENCCPMCGTIIQVKNCSGELVGTVGPSEDQIDREDLSDFIVFWMSPENECVFPE